MLVYEAGSIINLVVYDDEDVFLRIMLGDVGVGEFLVGRHFFFCKEVCCTGNRGWRGQS